MRIRITGSSGQIGTNLARRLMEGGPEVWGVDKRLNTWTREFADRTLLQVTWPVTTPPTGAG